MSETDAKLNKSKKWDFGNLGYLIMRWKNKYIKKKTLGKMSYRL